MGKIFFSNSGKQDAIIEEMYKQRCDNLEKERDSLKRQIEELRLDS